MKRAMLFAALLFSRAAGHGQLGVTQAATSRG